MSDNGLAPGRILRYLLTGAVVGALMTSVDGAILGAVLGSDAATPVEGALCWAGYFGAAGAVVGMIVGAVTWAVGRRMVLQPPEKKDKETRRQGDKETE
jgi:membrane protein DedA with SNARE-associated domain